MYPEIKYDLMQAQLFTLRIWIVRQEPDKLVWRAKLQNIQNGEVVYFKDWQAFTTHMEKTLNQQTEDQIEKREPGETPGPPKNLLSEKRS